MSAPRRRVAVCSGDVLGQMIVALRRAQLPESSVVSQKYSSIGRVYSGCTGAAKCARRCNASLSTFAVGVRQKMLALNALASFGTAPLRILERRPSGIHTRIRNTSASEAGQSNARVFLGQHTRLKRDDSNGIRPTSVITRRTIDREKHVPLGANPSFP